MTYDIENARIIREDLIFKVEGTAEWRCEECAGRRVPEPPRS